MIVSRRLILSCVFLLTVATRPAHALDPTRHISQYGHTAWRIRDGYLGASPNAIAQTADGYLWIGTNAGLVRFDGVRFVPWTPPSGRQLPSPAVYSLLAARDGSLWIGTLAGLSHWVNQDLINYQAGRGMIVSILEDRNGTVWISRTRPSDDAGILCQVIGTGMRCHGKADGIPASDNEGGALIEDAAGNLWIGGSTGIVQGKSGAFTAYTLSGLTSTTGVDGVLSLAANPDGSLWVGTEGTGPGLGLQQLDRGVWKPFVIPGLDGSTLDVHALFLDRENALWIGTWTQGIYRVHGHEVDRFRSADGLSGDSVYRFHQDREGNLWLVTTKGIDMFRDRRVATFSAREGLGTEEVDSVLASRDGTVWIGGDRALDALHRNQSRVFSIQTGKGLPGIQVTSLLEDHTGRLWVGIDTTLSLYRDGKFSRIDRSDGSRMGLVTGIAEDGDGNIWVVVNRPPRVLVRIRDLEVQEELSDPKISSVRAVAADPRGGIWLGLTNGDLVRYRYGQLQVVPFKHDSRVNQLFVNADGAVVGATAFGLIGWKEGTQQTLTVRNGLPCDGVNAFVTDRQGDLWLYMQCGLVQIASPQLQRWWEHPDVRLQVRTYDAFDGVEPGLAPFQGAARSADGRLWFANNGVLQMVDPAHLAANVVPPPVHVEEVIADRQSYAPRDDLRLPPLTRDIEIDYTALSFVVPQKVRFRYRLEGHDSDWQEPGTRRQAFYSALRPGGYTFRVIASNNDGLWNEAGATFTFSIAPAYYQTGWFQAISAGVLLLAGWGAHRARLWQIARRLRAQFATRAADRARIAEELHDTLIQDLAALSLQAEVMDDQLPHEPDAAKQTLETVRARMQRVVSDGRRGMTELHQGVSGGEDLADALSRAAQDLRGPNGPSFHIVVQGRPRALHPLVGDEVYRIAREAVANAFRHAAARRIDVEVSFTSDELRVHVHDDGRGVSEEVIEAGRPGHFGLQGMRKRARNIGATLTVWSRVDQGTEVAVIVPGRSAFQRPSRRPTTRPARRT
jgi:signal transduction histidine kinase/ligand-binding sensor domain-containing protein